MSEDSSKSVPDTQPARLPWGPLAAIVVVLFSFTILPVVANVLTTLLPRLLGWDSVRADEWLLDAPAAHFVYVVLAEALAVGTICWFAAYKKVSFWKAIAMPALRWRDPGYAIVGWIAYIVLFLIAITIVQQLTSIDASQEQALGFEKGIDGGALMMAFVSLVILPPLAEEIIFRGFFYSTLRSNRLGMWPTTILTSLIFAGLHLFGSTDGSLLWIAFVDTFALSVILCLVREKTGGIWAGIGIHALKNGFVFLNLFILGAA